MHVSFATFPTEQKFVTADGQELQGSAAYRAYKGSAASGGGTRKKKGSSSKGRKKGSGGKRRKKG